MAMLTSLWLGGQSTAGEALTEMLGFLAAAPSGAGKLLIWKAQWISISCIGMKSVDWS